MARYSKMTRGKYVYGGHTGRLYTDPRVIGDEGLYCDECCDWDEFLGLAHNRKEAADLCVRWLTRDPLASAATAKLQPGQVAFLTRFLDREFDGDSCFTIDTDSDDAKVANYMSADADVFRYTSSRFVRNDDRTVYVVGGDRRVR